ncbi:MAG: flavin reductase family protein [Pseudorhodoplanes sp.]|nr:flavin reductase family protein [Pseudorhodoplanes sp.]
MRIAGICCSASSADLVRPWAWLGPVTRRELVAGRVRFTASVRPGSGVTKLHSEFERLDLAGRSFKERYRLLNGSVIPRPIAFVSTLNEDGSPNAAPFSAFMIASVEEGYLAFSVGPSEHPKRTLVNIRRDREYVINTVPEALASQVQLCGEKYTPQASKFGLSGLTTLPSERVRAPRVAECKIQFECRLHSIMRFGESHTVVGEIVLMHARAGLVRDGKINPVDYGPLGRIAGRNYCGVRDIISV